MNSIKTCWEGDNTVSLPDLRTEDSDVLDVWKAWITDLVAKYSIDGLRLDSAQQVDNAFLSPFETAGKLFTEIVVIAGDKTDYIYSGRIRSWRGLQRRS